MGAGILSLVLVCHIIEEEKTKVNFLALDKSADSLKSQYFEG